MMNLKRQMWALQRIGSCIGLAALIAGCNASGAPEGAKITTTGEGQASYSQPFDPGSSDSTAAAANSAPYTVVAGDTIYGVAQRMHVTTQSLIDTNRLQPPYRLTPGQQLAKPGSGNYDPDLAVTTGTPAAGSTNGNGTSNGAYAGSAPRVITSTGGSIGMEDLAPAAGGSAAATRAPAASTAPATTQSAEAPLQPPIEDETQSDLPLTPSVEPAPSASATAPAESPQTAAIPDATTTDSQFQWPLQGKVVSRFGAKIGGQQNDGINIAGEPGAKVVAADNGVVAYSGNELKGFGNLLLIRHSNGWITAYAHNQKLLVKKGDKVKRGQPIATVGATGNVESPQLHFEIRRGSDPVDPLQHLAAQG